MKMSFFESLSRRDPSIIVQQNIPLKKYTTLRVGGPAEYFAEPASEEALMALLDAAMESETPVLLMGNGSNLLVRDGGYRGLVIRLGKAFSAIEQRESGLFSQAGALLSALSRTAADAGYTGLEFAQGIPGTVGGGVYMNAGAYGGEMSQIVDSVRVLRDGKIEKLSCADMEFGYRHSKAMEEGLLVLGASFHLEKGERNAIEAAMRDFAARRKEKQPLEYPSAGSFFKRPQGHFAGALIEQSGLKGAQVGGAQVSEKHAGFLINTGDATAADFLSLMEKVQETVWKNFQVALQPEVRIVGEEA